MEIKGILFDKDGTLIDFYSTWAVRVCPVLDRILVKNHLDGEPGLRSELLHMLGVSEDGTVDAESPIAWMPYNLIAERMMEVICTFLKCVPSGLTDEKLRVQLADTFFEEICGENMEYQTFTDVRAMVKELAAREIFVGLATTDEYPATLNCTEKLGIRQRIDFYGTAGRGLPVKPEGRLVEMAAEQWGIKPQEIAVVGDTPNDMRFAKNGGACAVAVLSGTGKQEELEPLADYVISSVDTLIPLLDRLEKN